MNSSANDVRSNGERGPLRFLIFSVSLRTGSLNTSLARLAARRIEEHGGTVDFAEMKEFDCPPFNQDSQDKNGFPAGVEQFRQRLEANNAFVISSPEYNASMPGLMKNAIDWVSRYRPQPFNGRHALLMSASPSMAGGNRGLWTLRVPFEHLGARVFPDMFSLASADQAFDTHGDIINATLSERFENTIIAFMDLVEAAQHYPCMKQAWIEFLGEKPEPAIDGVDQHVIRGIL